VADFAELAGAIGRDGFTVLDVRRTDEFDESRIPRAVNIPLHELVDRIGELPAGELWVHCSTGYRASIAASILDRDDRDVVLIDDEFETAEDLDLTEQS
jgi:hydroxyacylglutathione hydrolase